MQLVVTTAPSVTRVTLHSPDLPQARRAWRDSERGWRVELSGVSRYFILECAG